MPATPTSPLKKPGAADSDEDILVDEFDSDDISPEAMQALLARAKRAAKKAKKKTQLAVDVTRNLADTGLLRTERFHKKNSNGTGKHTQAPIP